MLNDKPSLDTVVDPHSSQEHLDGRYYLLDGLRGLAAFAVMFMHYRPDAPHGLFGHAFLAVDFFFLLSGLVIANAYAERLQRTMSVRQFFVRRAIRLYPMLVAGVFAVFALCLVLPPAGVERTTLAKQALLNALLIPDIEYEVKERFPLILPSWSLFYELIVNMTFALIAPWLSARVNLTIILLSGITLAISIYWRDTINFSHHYAALAYPRTLFSFLVGVAIFQHMHRASSYMHKRRSALYALICCIVLGLTLIVPLLKSWNWLYEIICLFLIYPVLIYIGAQINLGTRARRLAALLGELSYPVYVLHMPMIFYVGASLGWFHVAPNVSVMVALIATPAVGWLALKFYDEPIRRYLSAALR